MNWHICEEVSFKHANLLCVSIPGLSGMVSGSPARSSPTSGGSEPGGERFSRKVFVGGLPPDIDEGKTYTQSTFSGLFGMVSGSPPDPPSTAGARSPEERGSSGRCSWEAAENKFFYEMLYLNSICQSICNNDIRVCITDEITSSFRRFGALVVDWPHKAESKSYFPPKGYAFLLFQVSKLSRFIILKQY